MVPLFSIIIPTFNRRDYLRQALQSVFDQEFTGFEVIVVDDGSTEDVSSVVEEHRGRVRFIRQDNAGPGAARNRGAQTACGEYLAFLDSDDVWFPWTLQVYADVIRAAGQPALVSGSLRAFDKQDELADETPGVPSFQTYTDYYASAAHGLYCSTCQMVVRRDAFNRIGGFTRHHINAEDHDLVMRMGTESGFVHVTGPVMIGYRRHAGSVSASLDKTHAGMRHLVIEERSGRYPGGFVRRKERQEVLARHLRPVCLALVNHGHFGNGWRLFLSTMGWQIGQHRWKYLLAFPFITIASMVGLFKRRRASGADRGEQKPVVANS